MNQSTLQIIITPTPLQQRAMELLSQAEAKKAKLLDVRSWAEKAVKTAAYHDREAL